MRANLGAMLSLMVIALGAGCPDNTPDEGTGRDSGTTADTGGSTLEDLGEDLSADSGAGDDADSAGDDMADLGPDDVTLNDLSPDDLGLDTSDITTDEPPVEYEVSGIAIGSEGTALSIQLNGGETVMISAEGPYEFTFTTTLPTGSDYSVTFTQPNPDLNCFSGQASGTALGDVNLIVTCTGGVHTFFPGDNNWLDSVDNTMPAVAPADRGACDPDVFWSWCWHTAIVRELDVPGRADCTDLTAEDSLRAFQWLCDDAGESVVMRSFGLQPGVGLTDMLTFGETPAFIPIDVTVDLDTEPYARSIESTWWENPIVRIESSEGRAGLAESGTVYVLADASLAATITSDYITVVVDPSVTLSPSFAVGGTAVIEFDGSSFGWFEGRVDATGFATGVLLSETHRVVVRRSEIFGADADAGTSGLHVAGSRGSLVADVHAHDAEVGIRLTATIGASLLRVRASENGQGVFLGASGLNIAIDLRVDRNSAEGLALEGSSWNAFGSAYSVNNEGGGIVLATSTLNTFLNVIVANNGAPGLTLDRSHRNAFANLLVTNNEGNGVTLAQSNYNVLIDVLVANAKALGFWLNGGDANVLMNLISVNASAVGMRLTDATNTVVANIAIAHNSNTEVIDISGGENNRFLGHLMVDRASCSVEVEVDVTPPLDADCNAVGLAETDFFQLTSGIDLSEVFIGKLPDPGGTANAVDILNWTEQESPWQSWGADGPAFPNFGNRGQCADGACRIWDWRLASDDTVLQNVLAQPDPESEIALVVVHPDPANEGMNQTFLLNAIEFINPFDGVGDNDNLCEAGETCLYTPNIGVFQGAGIFEEIGTYSDGVVDDVLLFQLSEN